MKPYPNFPSTLYGSRRRHLRQPPWKLVFRPPSRLSYGSHQPSSTAISTAPSRNHLREACSAHHHCSPTPASTQSTRRCSEHHRTSPQPPPHHCTMATADLHLHVAPCHLHCAHLLASRNHYNLASSNLHA
ncbi:hypothetical protein DEO72_LG7g1474 [Vigna unguiculata]|uniref:Uncharacterized protein n=1 Tax=Vigna unguiculata TaxID=3917 RepID=A0A4D6MJL5_VIGUN|nr:hypothetical protein DEO72_LG7g1474 [Vigna unguiculata]